MVDTALERAAMVRTIGARVSSTLVSPGLVAQSDLLATLPSRIARHFSAVWPLQVPKPPLVLEDVTHSISWHERTHHNPAHLTINPNSNANTTQSMTEIAATATGAVKVEGKTNEGLPPLLTPPKDLADALPGVLKIGVEAAKDSQVGAIIIAAFGDPGLPELRAKVDLPVFGIREQAFREAARDGRPFGIANTTPDPGLLGTFRQTAAALGPREPVPRHACHSR